MRGFKPLALVLVFAIASTTGAAMACRGTGQGLLTVSRAGAEPSTVVLDRACLKSLPHHSIRSSTLWADHPSIFEGVLMHDLLDSLQFEGTSVRMVAVSDYQISAPIEYFLKYDVLVACTQNGAALDIRTMIPLWVVYPIDDHSELANKQISAKMI